MPHTPWEIRELKKEMAHRREIKERIQALKKKGLVEYEGKVIPVMEARKQGGMKGNRYENFQNESDNRFFF